MAIYARVAHADGSEREYGTRERPFLLLADAADGAAPLALYTAVTPPGTSKEIAGEDFSFTLVQPVASSAWSALVA